MTSWTAVAIAAGALAGCATHPLPSDLTRVSTYDIVQQIRCEAKRAVIDDRSYYRTASIAYEFEFDITENNVAGAGAVFAWPFTAGGGFGLEAGGSIDRTRANVRNIRITDRFQELLAIKCDAPPPRIDALYPVAGDIGTYEVVTTFIALQQADNSRAGDVFTFSDKLRFTTVLQGHLNPTLTLIPLADQFRLAQVNATLSGQRRDIHAVTLTLAGAPRRLARGGGIPMKSFATRTGSAPGSSLVGTTVLQDAIDPRDRALLELDRQRILTLQNRAGTVLVTP